MICKLKCLWLIAVTAIIGLAVSACDNGGTTSAHTHTAGAAATCVTPQTCTSCGEVMQGATGHDFEHDDWDEDEIDASCEHPSYDTIACKNAPCTIKDKRTGSHPALGHDLPGAYAATCMAKGSTGTGHCYRCDEDKTGVPLNVDPENHDFSGTPVITPATCTTDGKEVINCGNNGCTETHGTVLEALKHEGTIQPFAATCTTAGNSAALSGNCVRFAQCGHVVTGTVIPALGHLVNSWDWTTYNSSNGYTSCTRDNCSGGLAAIGDTGPAGGIIFYVADDTDGRPDGIIIQGYTGATGSFDEYTAYYLEAAPENASGANVFWSNTNILIPNLSQNSTDTTDRAIGRGRLNTAIIIAAHTADTVADNAAKAAAAYTNGGKDDWFLPSREELNQMYIQRSHVGITAGGFWSSSQGNNAGAWDQVFSSGNQFNVNKNSYYNVRAIRAF